MKKSTVGKAAGVTASAALALLLGTGVASADPLVGETYSKASEIVSGWGGTAIVSNTFGERVQRDDCIVASWHKNPNNIDQVYLALNCSDKVATPGHAGNSAASPAGRKEKQRLDDIQWLSENPDYCRQALVEHPEWGELEGCDYDAVQPAPEGAPAAE